jgi:hypothetical protein
MPVGFGNTDFAVVTVLLVRNAGYISCQVHPFIFYYSDCNDCSGFAEKCSTINSQQRLGGIAADPAGVLEYRHTTVPM